MVLSSNVLLVKFRQNLKNLVDLTPQSGDPNNHARTFWRWLRKQSWRRMLPETVAFLDCSMWSSNSLVH